MKCSGKIEDGTSNKPLNFGSDLWLWQRFVFVCLLAGLAYSMSYERISMKFSGKIGDGTSNKPLDFGSDPWPVCLSVSILLETL